MAKKTLATWLIGILIMGVVAVVVIIYFGRDTRKEIVSEKNPEMKLAPSGNDTSATTTSLPVKPYSVQFLALNGYVDNVPARFKLDWINNDSLQGLVDFFANKELGYYSLLGHGSMERTMTFHLSSRQGYSADCSLNWDPEKKCYAGIMIEMNDHDSSKPIKMCF